MRWNKPKAALCVFCLGWLGVGEVWCEDAIVSTVEELEAAVAGARPGDSVVVRNGGYTNWRATVWGNGEDNAPITVRAQTPGGVKLTGNVRIQISGTHLVVTGFRFQEAVSSRHAAVVEFRRARRCRLTECAFYNCGDPESTFTRTINLTYGSSWNRVDHCYMTGTLSMGMGIVVRDSASGIGNSDNRFDHNHFENIQRLSSNGQEPIQLGQDQTAYGDVSARTIVEYNLFENASGDSEIVSNKSADNVIRYNTLRNSRAGICLRGGRNALVEGNYCLRTRAIRVFGSGHRILNNYLKDVDDGVRLDAGQYAAGDFVNRKVSGSYEAASDVIVAYNTIVKATNSGITIGRNNGTRHENVIRGEMPRDVCIRNNVVIGNRGVLVQDLGGQNVTWQDNFVWPEMRATLGLTQKGIVAADPLLEGTRGQWRVPAAASPAKTAGARAYEHRAEMSEYGSQSGNVHHVRLRPLEPEDVGPAWRRRTASAASE